VANQEDRGENHYKFGLPSITVHTANFFLYAVKTYDMGPTALRPLQRKACCGFLLTLIDSLGRVWTRESWDQWKTH
jgi:hypothetical protein